MATESTREVVPVEDRIPSGEATTVSIFGQTYHLRGTEDGAYLDELASLVDRQMREVVEATQTADTLKVAILAALNIADDYVQARRGNEVPLDRQTDRRLARLVTQLDEALAG
jgi:cell division protein ZapA